MATNQHGNRQIVKIFSLDADGSKASLGFRPRGSDPVVEAIDIFQTALVSAVEAAMDKQRGGNPHADVSKPKTAEALVADCGDNWVQTLRAKFEYVCKFAKFFAEGGKFPLMIHGREASPYSTLAEGIVTNPALVKSEQKAFTGVEHHGHPFKKPEVATG